MAEVEKVEKGTSDIIKDILKKSVGDKIVDVSGRTANGPVVQYKISYNSSSETLEPIYFWILDMMNSFFGGKVEKLVDNFASSPGSGHFSELGMKKSTMQKNINESMQTIGLITKSIINLIYDLKDFEIRLKHYDDANSKDKELKQAGMLALKQVWLDNVDIKRGNGSIHAMSQGLNFVTLRDAFIAADTLKEVDKLDLNERVIRILKPRLSEFLIWRESSEKELRNRFNIEKNYLKSQVNSLRLYSRWVKPYLKSAAQLESKDMKRNPALVNVFNTLFLELTLMGKSPFDFEGAIQTAQLPKGLRKPKRNYNKVCLVDFVFRGIPQKAGQHYVLGGKVDVTFNGFILNDDEIKVFEKELAKSDINEMLKLGEEATSGSLEHIQEELEKYIGEKKEKKEEKKSNDNPFSALFDLFKTKKEDKKKDLELKDLKKDNYEEKMVRKLAGDELKEVVYTIYYIS